MNRRALLIVFWVIASPASGAPVPKELKKDDAARFVGEWWESANQDEVYPDAATARRFRFGKDGALGIHQNAVAPATEYTVVVDPTTTPRTFVLKGKGAAGNAGWNAVYKLEGDTLRFVLTLAGEPLLKEAAPDAGGLYYELKRVK